MGKAGRRLAGSMEVGSAYLSSLFGHFKNVVAGAVVTLVIGFLLPITGAVVTRGWLVAAVVAGVFTAQFMAWKEEHDKASGVTPDGAPLTVTLTDDAVKRLHRSQAPQLAAQYRVDHPKRMLELQRLISHGPAHLQRLIETRQAYDAALGDLETGKKHPPRRVLEPYALAITAMNTWWQNSETLLREMFPEQTEDVITVECEEGWSPTAEAYEAFIGRCKALVGDPPPHPWSLERKKPEGG